VKLWEHSIALTPSRDDAIGDQGAADRRLLFSVVRGEVWSAILQPTARKDSFVASTSSSLFSPGTWAENGRARPRLRKETVGGGLLLLANVIALVWANTSFSDSYFTLLATEIGPAPMHLNLTGFSRSFPLTCRWSCGRSCCPPGSENRREGR
jgi:Na+/H+ antiporter 1